MEIILYNTFSENNRVDKVLNNETYKTGVCRENIDIINPVVTIKGYIKNYNYCFIPSFSRYFFIDNIILSSGLTVLSLRIDVLMSYKNEIRLLQAILDKQENGNNNPYINDGYTVDTRPKVEKVLFENNFSDGEYILITVKGGES